MSNDLNDYSRLFSPARIGPMQLANRIVMSPMTTDYGTAEQMPSDRLMAYLEERAKGGVGLISLEVCSVDSGHRYQGSSLSLGEDRFVEAHRALTDMVHSHGVKIQPQITHPGPESLALFFEGGQSIGPSVNVNPGAYQHSRELPIEEIPGIIEQYVKASLRAKQAGYDGMELHAAHAYMLLGSFLSPLRNARNDAYGGRSLRKRARLLLETLTAIKAAVGEDFPVTVSLSGYERFPNGRDIQETQRLAQMLVEAGADAFRISGGATDRLVTQMVMGSEYPDAVNATAGEAIKRVVDVPVMVVGRIHTPELAEQVLAEGRADLIAMARPFLADPTWPNKVKSGRRSDMRQCISCENCIDSMVEFQNLNCAVNAQTGRELENRLTPAVKTKKVLVVGGGPGGMETARVAALRGHSVTLVERQKRLGGSLVLASTVHSDNEPFLHWLRRQISESTVDVRLQTDCTMQLVSELKPDAIVVASGAQVITPDIPGSDAAQVMSGAQLRSIVEGRATAADFRMLPTLLRPLATLFLSLIAAQLTPALMRRLTRYWLPMGSKVLVVGGDLAALELAEFLAARGRHVSIVESGKRLAPEVGPKRLAEHMMRLDHAGIVINTEMQVMRIEPGKVMCENANGALREIAADTVILAGDPVAETSLFESLKGQAAEVYAVGDCTGLGLVRKATDDGMRVGCSL